LFFINCVSLAKKIKKGDENTANNTGWGAVMLGYIIFANDSWGLALCHLTHKFTALDASLW
jgi:hypothetical protein